MIVFYEPTTLTWTHVVSTYDASYLAWVKSTANTQLYIESPTVIPVMELYLVKDSAGVVTALQKQAMTIACAALSVTLGGDMQFSNVPNGATIVMNGAQIGVMDATGALDITASVAGLYAFTFSLAGYMDGVFTVEVISQS